MFKHILNRILVFLKKTNWKKSSSISGFLCIFFFSLFYIKFLIIVKLSINNFAFLIACLICLGLSILLSIPASLSQVLYENFKPVQSTVDRLFLKKYGIENVLFPKVHSDEEILKIIGNLETKIKRFDKFKEDAEYHGFFCAFIVIFMNHQIVSFYFSNTLSFLADILAVCFSLGKLYQFGFSRISKMERFCRNLLEQYKTELSTRRENE